MAKCFVPPPKHGSCLRIESSYSNTMMALLVIPRSLTNPSWLSSIRIGRISVNLFDNTFDKILYTMLHNLLSRISKGYLVFLRQQPKIGRIMILNVLSTHKEILNKLNYIIFYNQPKFMKEPYWYTIRTRRLPHYHISNGLKIFQFSRKGTKSFAKRIWECINLKIWPIEEKS